MFLTKIHLEKTKEKRSVMQINRSLSNIELKIKSYE